MNSARKTRDNPPKFPKRKWYEGIYVRFAAATCLSFGLVAIVNIFITTHIWVEVAEDVEQRRNWNLAENIAVQLQPKLARDYDSQWVTEQLFFYSQLYPSVRFYLLDEYGKIMLQTEYNASLAFDHVPIGEIVEATKPVMPRLPIRSVDPTSGNPAVFSVTKTVCDNKPCYLYLTLTAGLFNMLQDKQGEYHTIQYAAVLVVALLVLLGLLCFALFLYLSGGFRDMLSVVRSIEKGDYSRKIEIKSNDEIAEISHAINSMADAVEESLEALAQTDQQRRELIANISHDLRSPLTVIEGFLETILKKHDHLSYEERTQYLERIYRNVLQQKQLTSDLFELSKLEAKERQPNLEPFSILELAYDAVHKFAAQAEQKSITICVNTTKDPGAVLADISMIDRVISNLISNAIRYCPEGSTVMISVIDMNQRVRIEVSDDGEGISDEDAKHIFDSFYRVDKDRSRVSGGTGLGLAIVKKMIESHGQEIELRSELGEGACFAFTLNKALGLEQSEAETSLHT